ncbi:hypothetical protein GCM10010913_33040 [Paenibacillus aceti]|uniref:Uncharacterized protein n=1 Tax=Paenibacillus aceti TaxID=1820010 RepID=A0ABQ1W0G1_9BACL|nr:hypothetical protein GCM10010913_33040 [Paenibacillus aceti]
MITARGLISETSGVVTRPAPQPQSKQPAQPVTIQRKIEAKPGSIHATVTLEAIVENTGEVVRTESFRTTQPVMQYVIITRLMGFKDDLAADGYEVRV